MNFLYQSIRSFAQMIIKGSTRGLPKITRGNSRPPVKAMPGSRKQGSKGGSSSKKPPRKEEKPKVRNREPAPEMPHIFENIKSQASQMGQTITNAVKLIGHLPGLISMIASFLAIFFLTLMFKR